MSLLGVTRKRYAHSEFFSALTPEQTYRSLVQTKEVSPSSTLDEDNVSIQMSAKIIANDRRRANTAAPASRHSMPMAMRRSKFSWKMNHAISAVAAPSRVSNSEAVAASVRTRPAISKSGPRIPPAAIAPASQGQSSRPSARSRACGGRKHGRRRSAQDRDANAGAAIEQTGQNDGLDRPQQRLGGRRRCAE